MQYCDPWDSGPAAAALRLLRADERKSPAPASAAVGALSADEMARQRHIYETAFDSRVKQRDPDTDLDRMAQSPVLLAGLQQPRSGPLYPLPSAAAMGQAQARKAAGVTRQSSLQDACGPKPPPHQGSSSSISASSSQQQQPAPTPRGSSSGGSGNPSVPIPATRGQGASSKQASAADKAIYQNHPLPQSPISENPPAAPLGAVAVKRSIHAGVKVLPSEPVRRPRHGRKEGEPMPLAPVLLNGFRSTSSDNVSSSSSSDNSPRRPDEKRGRHGPLLQSAANAANASHAVPIAAPLQNGASCALQSFRASPSVDSLSNSSCDSPRKPEEKRGRLVAVAPPVVHNGIPYKGTPSSLAETENGERRLLDNSKRLHPAVVRPQLQHNQSPGSDTRPESDYDRPWDLPRIKRSNGDSPPQVPDHRSRPAVQSPTQQHMPSSAVASAASARLPPPPSPEPSALAAEPSRASPAPTASSSGGGPSSSSPSVAMMASSSSSSSNTSIAMESPAAVGPAARPNAPARPLLNLNLNLNASNSPKRSRRNLTLNFGCAALSAVGEKVDASVALEKQGWYHGSISRLDAENLLRVLKEGSYLVRNSESSKRGFSLSLRSARGFMHMKIVHSEDGKFILGQFSKPFESIPEMIHHYSVNKLPIKGAEHMSLLHPVIDQLL